MLDHSDRTIVWPVGNDTIQARLTNAPRSVVLSYVHHMEHGDMRDAYIMWRLTILGNMQPQAKMMAMQFID